MPQANPLRRAQQLITAKDYHGAIQLLEPYLGQAPSDLDALHLAGMAYFEAKQFAAAEDVYLEMWSVRPDDIRSTYGVAIAAEKSGRTNDAERWFRATLALDPTFDRAAKRLAQLQTTHGVPLVGGGNRRPGSAAPRPMTTLLVPSSPEEVAEYERWAREKARIDMMNEHWYGIPWPVRVLGVVIGLVVLAGFAAAFLA
jgi:tetratricopeptide (TPR) repeat protein